jgi:hypothetical protein
MEDRIRDVDDDLADLAKTVAADVEELLDIETEYEYSNFEYDAETSEKTATVRFDLGIASELQERYEDVVVEDTGRIDVHFTVDDPK